MLAVKLGTFGLVTLASVLAGGGVSPRTLVWVGLLALVGIALLVVAWRRRRKRAGALRPKPAEDP